MSDERQAVEKVSWQEVFGFTKLFKGFAVAMRPGMLTLGILLLLMIFLGGWALDTIWSTWDSAMVPGEIMLRARDRQSFDKMQQARDKYALQQAARLLENSQIQAESLSNYMMAISNPTLKTAFTEKLFDVNNKDKSESPARQGYMAIYNKALESGKGYEALVADIRKQNAREIEKIDAVLDGLHKKASKMIKVMQLSKQAKAEKLDALDAAFVKAQKAVTLRKIQQRDALLQIEGAGIFEGFIAFERNCIYNGIMSVRHLNFTGGLAEYGRYKTNRQLLKNPDVEVMTGLNSPAAVRGNGSAPGLVFFLLMALEGIMWLIATHPVYAAIFLLWCLLNWAVFGGAMYRMASMRFARWQTIGIVEALRFSSKRLITFFAAPIIPLVVVTGLGLLIAALSLLGNIPFAGPMIVAIVFVVFIVLGMVMAGILIFYICSVSFQYPVLAATGCDACGAISDSYSYLLQKPFHMVFYGVVASIYGMITYLFVRLFAFIGLSLIHVFIKLGVFSGGSALGSGADGVDVLWAKPEYWDMHSFNWMAAGPWESLCSILIGVWVNLVIAGVGAYLISYFVSSSTISYFLIRNKCDSSDFDDIYIEGEDDAPLELEFAEKVQAAPQDQPAQPSTEDVSNEDA